MIAGIRKFLVSDEMTQRDAVATLLGNASQNRAVVMGKARSPSVERHVTGTTKAAVDTECKLSLSLGWMSFMSVK